MVSSQMRASLVSHTGGRVTHLIGLDYSAARVAWQLAELEMTPALFSEVQMIEVGAADALKARGAS